MSNIVGNYFRLHPLTESRALWRPRRYAFAGSVDGVETDPESGNPREGDTWCPLRAADRGVCHELSDECQDGELRHEGALG